jgi:SAM-dependent methyltransferase
MSQLEVPPAPYQPDRFRSTVAHYVAHRPRYPAALLKLVLTHCGLGPGARVLDLGCGPGFLANGFSELGLSAVGIDPSPEMLHAARAEATDLGLTSTFRQGSSYDLDAMDDRFDLTVLGRAFHWMDRPQTLASLNRLMPAHGAVVLFYDQHPRCTENAAITIADTVREKYGRMGAPRRAPKSKVLVPDEAVFLDSPFCHLLRLGLIERRPVDAATLIGRSLSTSFTSPESLGDRQAAFEAELGARLRDLRPDGQFTELIEFTALIATRQ